MNFLRIAALLGLLLCSGCIAQIPYAPNAGIVTDLGPEQAENEFRDLLTARTQSPQIYEVELIKGGFVYRFAGGVYVGWGATAVGDGSVRILFSTVARTDIYENRKVFMVDGGGQRLGHEMVFATLDDCKMFADFLASYRAQPQRQADRGAAEQASDSDGGSGAPPPNQGGAPR